MSVNAGESRPRSESQNISLSPVERAALRVLASDERNGNISAAVARLIDNAMTVRYGKDWRTTALPSRESRDEIPLVA